MSQYESHKKKNREIKEDCSFPPEWFPIVGVLS